jgi:hypothetical protein
MHSFVDDFIRWLNRTFFNREWRWPVTEQEEGPQRRPLPSPVSYSTEK